MIIQAILNINHFLVKEVKRLEEIITLEYTTPNLHLISEILREGDYGRIPSLKPAEDLFGEYIGVFRYTDEWDRSYYALIYDPTGLYEKLVILEMFRHIDRN